MRGVRLALLALPLAAAALPGCSREGPLAGSNVVLVVVDTLRADHLGSYGHERPTSPFFDRLASRGVLFEDATTPSSQTVPSMVSILSGVRPHRHGNHFFPETNSVGLPRREQRPRIPGDVPLLAEMLQAAGYRTAAVATNPWLRPEYGFARGFDTWRYVHGERLWNHPLGEDVNRVATELLPALASQQPFFLYLHYMDVHPPLRPTPRHRGRFTAGLPGKVVLRNGPAPDLDPVDAAFTRARYDEAIRSFDDHLRALVAALQAAGLGEDLLLVVTADHGEEFLDHGGSGHGFTLYQEVLRAPLLFVHPRLPDAPRRISAPVASVDLAPTLLALLGIDAPAAASFDGASLASLVWGGESAAPPERRLLVSELGPRVAVRRGPHKLIRERASGPARRFDLARDPGERAPLAGEEVGGDETWEALAAEARRLIDAAAERRAELWAGRESPAPDPEVEEQLRALGYAEPGSGDAAHAAPP